MLTPRQNLLETVRGGNPERFVNQYEYMTMLFHPYIFNSNALLSPGQTNIVNAWGVTNSFPEGTPGAFPVHTPDKIVIKDITRWRDYVHAPSLEFSDEQWEQIKEQYDQVDRNEVYAAVFVAPGIFEQTHHLGEIAQTLMNYMLEPDSMHDLIKYLTEWELKLAEGICSKLHPDLLFHHDDWGGELSTFLAPSMFEDFFIEPYKQIYGYYHDHGVELVVHHSDSYNATLVPAMIEMGIDIWQGCMKSNNIPELISKYGGKISFMGGIDNKAVDKPGWTREDCRKIVRETCDACGKHYFIPCITQGGPGSVAPGAYAVLTEEIDAYSRECFPNVNEIKRPPLQIIF